MIHTRKRLPVLPLIIGFVLVGLALVLSLQSPNNIFTNGSTTVDSGVFIYMGRVILNGGMPYRDAFDHKGPLLYLINALGIWLSPAWGVWFMDFTAILITFLFVYRIARLKCNSVFSLAVVVGSTYELFQYYIEANGTETYAMPFVAVAAYIFIDYFLNKKINPLRLAICGLSFGAVFLLRPNMISVWLVMCIGVLMQCIIDKNLKQIGFFLGWFLLGFFLLCGPIILWLCINDAFFAFLDNYFIFNLIYSADPVLSNIYAKARAFFYFFAFPSTLLCFCLTAFLCAIKKDLFHYLYLAVILVSLLLMALSGWTSEHYAMILIPVVAYPFSCAAGYIECDVNKKHYSVIPVTLMLLVNFVAPAWFGGVQDAINDVNYRKFDLVNERDQAVRDLILQYSQEDDKIIVCGNYNLYYNLTDRFAASRYSYQWPIIQIDSSKEQEFFQDLYENTPKIIVLFHDFYAYDAMQVYMENYYYTDISCGKIDRLTVYLLES